MWRALVVILAACACPPPAAPTLSSNEGLPPPDAQLRRWQAIHANDDRVPAGTTAAALIPELVAYLGSIDPVRRDGIAFEVLVRWIVKDRVLTPAELRPLIATLTGNLRVFGDPDGVYARSFSALVLSLVVKRDLDEPFLDDAARRALLDAAVTYAGRETDLRGHTGARGWAHAAAHTADLLKFLAREPTFTDADRLRVLDAVAVLTTRRHGENFHHGEDSRLAVAVLDALARGVPDEAIEPWVQRLAAPLAEPPAAAFDPAHYAAQRNARDLLFTLFGQLSLAPALEADATATLRAIRAILAG